MEASAFLPAGSNELPLKSSEASSPRCSETSRATTAQEAYVPRNSKSGHQLMQNNWGGMLKLSSG